MGPTLFPPAREQARQDVGPNRHLNLILVLTHVGEQFLDLNLPIYTMGITMLLSQVLGRSRKTTCDVAGIVPGLQ